MGTQKFNSDIDVSGEVKGTSLDVNGAADISGNTQLSGTLTVGVDDTGHDVKFFGATSGRYMEWDESADSLLLRDDVRLKIGSNTDMQLYHQSSIDTNILELSKKLHIVQNQNDGDIQFSCDDGSGGIATYLTLDGGLGYMTAAKSLRFSDSVSAYFGASNDLTIQHDGSNSYIVNTVGNMIIANNTDDGDIIFQSDDASGGVETYLTLDGGLNQTTVQKNMRFHDNVRAEFGIGANMSIFHSGDDASIINNTGELTIAQNTDDGKIIFKTDNGSGGITAYLTLDGSAGTVEVAKPTNFGVDDTGHDVKFFGATAGSFLLWDESDDSLNLTDNTKLKFGDGNDFNMFHDGSNSFIQNQVGHLRIKNNADNKDIVFQCDNGSGGITAYLTLDGGEETLVASVPLVLEADSTVGWHGSVTRVKILPRDFQPDNGGRPAMIVIATNEAYLASNGSGKLFASVPIPTGFKATHVKIHGSDTGQTFTVYEANIANKVTETIGTATAIETEKAITNVDSTTTNFILIEVSSDGTTDEIHGGYMTIAAI